MRGSVVLVLALALTARTIAPAMAQDSDDVLAPAIEHCIRDNAAKVEARRARLAI